MRPICVLLYPNLKHLSLTFSELLDVDAPIHAVAATFERLYGTPKLMPIQSRIAISDLMALADVAGVRREK